MNFVQNQTSEIGRIVRGGAITKFYVAYIMNGLLKVTFESMSEDED